MIVPKQAASLLKKKFPKLVITECVELPSHWLFTALEDPNDIDYNDPFYAVRKSDGVISSYSPFDDIENFNRAKPVKF